MKGLRKYLGILFILSVFPLIHFVSTNFILKPSDDIYNYVPQESDVVIEINMKNFLTEALYQKVFNENYFNRKIFPPGQEEKPQKYDAGIDMFSKIILFREVWSSEIVWVAVVAYTDKKQLNNFLSERVEGVKAFYGDDYAIIQLRPSNNQEQLSKHLEKIANGKVKSFSERVDLHDVFDPEKEINTYLVKRSMGHDSKIIDGYLNFDFLQDEIKVSGEFIPISELENSPSIAYAINNDVAFSMRSSLNLFNSIYWFSREKLDSVPQYHQMAFDYDGVGIFLCDKDLDYDFPMKQFPDAQIHFDINNIDPWKAFLGRLERKGDIKIDSTARMISTRQGTFFQYKMTENSFRLMRGEHSFEPRKPGNVYFKMQMQVDPLLSNCKFQVDEKNPPGALERTAGMLIANEMVADIKMIATMEKFNFRLTLSEDSMMIAEGHGVMKEKNGHSIIESMDFGMGAIFFLKNYF